MKIFIPEQILDDEYGERQLAKAEQTLTKAERRLLAQNKKEKANEPERLWFQTKKQRVDEKDRLDVNPEKEEEKKKKPQKRKRKNSDSDYEDGPPVLSFKKKEKKEEKKTPSQMAKERAMRELEKVSLVQAKMSKYKLKPRKIRSMDETTVKTGPKPNRKGKSRFDLDLTDTTPKGAKRLRYDATKHKKEVKRNAKKTGKTGPAGPTRSKNAPKKTSSIKLANKAGLNQANKGKKFGGPRPKAKHNRKK